MYMFLLKHKMIAVLFHFGEALAIEQINHYAKKVTALRKRTEMGASVAPPQSLVVARLLRQVAGL